MAIVHFVNYKRGTQSRAAMRGVMLYVMQEKKSAWEGEPLVSSINCQPQSVYDDFLNTKLLYHKDGGVMFYHMVQSFPKGAAVDPRQAHEAARRLAEYFNGCEVLVCTHVDREHIHSHCVINSVNFETGKKLHMAKEQLQELMRRNDAICLEMGLPVFEAAAQQARGMSGAEYHTALRGQSWKLRLMNTIDECMKYATDKDAFVSLMAAEGYAVCWESSRKYITYTTPEGMRCRDSKLHEEKYCKEVMEHEFRIRAEIVSARTQAAQLPADSTAGAGTTSRSTSHESGLGANDEIHGYTVAPCGSADGSVGERQQADVAASHANAAGRSAESGAASGADDRTGWEAEREFFFSAQNQTSQTASATCQYSGIDLSADGGGSTASALVGLGHCLEQLQSAAPVMPARHYTDRKALQKEREKKIALGHKADDHEDEVSYDWQQTM
ncbi:relaxase/mobilization nuclease domain-containing protein [Dysosmobacter sp.]|jgi:hypothetical protein|uniref:relaxase/mobilization nuclease domain-containing protein n=1 Tax=Dysosmobacter sp. TaxID=2591382 RepID=UPI003AB3BDAF